MTISIKFGQDTHIWNTALLIVLWWNNIQTVKQENNRSITLILLAMVSDSMWYFCMQHKIRKGEVLGGFCSVLFFFLCRRVNVLRLHNPKQAQGKQKRSRLVQTGVRVYYTFQVQRMRSGKQRQWWHRPWGQPKPGHCLPFPPLSARIGDSIQRVQGRNSRKHKETTVP